MSPLHRTFIEDGVTVQGEKVERMEDAALLQAVALGNQDAMATVFDRYSRIVYCIALRVLHDTSLAEDVMQEVLLQVWKRPQSFVVQRGSLSAWLSVVARNRAIDVLRKRAPMDPLGELPLPDPHDMAYETEQGWLLEKVREVLDSLPPDQQASLDLAYFQGLSHTEIAAAHGVAIRDGEDPHTGRADEHTKGDDSMTDNLHIADTDLALYAIGALPRAEAGSVADHLKACAVCREELRRNTLALGAYAQTTPVWPVARWRKAAIYDASGNDPASHYSANREAAGSI